MSGPIEEFLVEVSKGIGEVDARVLHEALAEIRGHLEDSASGYVELGLEREEAEQLAILAFGSREEVQKVVEKPAHLLDHSVLPIRVTAVLVGCLPLALMLSRFLLDAISIVVVGLYLSIGLGLVVTGYRRRGLEWARLCVSLAVGSLAAACLVAPFLRIGVGGGLETISEFNRNWQTNVEYWDRDRAANMADFGLMREVINGTGKHAIEATKSEQGYLLPHDGSYSYNDNRKHTNDLSIALAAWEKEAHKFDVEKRAVFADQADRRVRMEMASASRLHFATNVWEIGKDYGRSIAALGGALLFLQSIGLLMRLCSEAVSELIRRRRRSSGLRRN